MPWTSLDLTTPPNWNALSAAIPQADAMKACIQDPGFHAEGDVWTHTMAVCRELQSGPAADMLPEVRHRGLMIAAVLHDVAKPLTREVVFDEALGRERVTHHNHSPIGARDAWGLLYKAGVDLETRLQVYALIAAHQRPFHTFQKKNPEPEIARLSLDAPWRELLLLARADNRGRIAPSVEATEETLELLEMQIAELGCLDGPWEFPSVASRTRVVRGNASRLHFAERDPKGSRVIVTSAPPGAGKDTYLAHRLDHLPQVSLDALREEMDVEHGDNQGQVIQAAYERAREHLRKKAPFVWNTTGMSKLMRDKITDLAIAYDGHVAVHAIDTPYAVMTKRNRERAGRVPEEAIERMMLRWQPPQIGEAHEIVWIDGETFEPISRWEPATAPAMSV